MPDDASPPAESPAESAPPPAPPVETPTETPAEPAPPPGAPANLPTEASAPTGVPVAAAEVPVGPAEAESTHTLVYESIPPSLNEPPVGQNSSPTGQAISEPKNEITNDIQAVEPEPPHEIPPPQTTSAPAAPPRSRELLVQARAKRAANMQKNLERIMAELEKTGTISNNGVQKLLNTSNATAIRYLSMLVKQGKIKREGNGRGVVYVKT